MAGFCRNCGSPLEDGQGFCTRCGTPASGPPRPPTPPEAVPQPRPATPRPLPQTAAAAPSKSGSTLIKVLLVFFVVIFLFGAIGVAGIWFVAHRARQEFHEIGMDDLSAANANRS